MTANEIIDDIKRGFVKPIYFLYGLEPYFIDVISDYIEENLLKEEEKSFDQIVQYGRDVEINELIASARRYPMLAARQLIIIKEAQDLTRNIDQLEPYLENPMTSTVLVFNYKYKTPDNRKSVFKKMAKVAQMFESKPLYENQVPAWIDQYVKSKSYKIEPKSAVLLVEYLGNDLGRIANELGKLFISLPLGHQITAQDIEENIGISKDFNIFELRKALGSKNVVKANQIINYFAQNPAQNPVILTISQLNAFFTLLLQYHATPNNHDKHVVARVLKVNPFFVGEYMEAGKNYPMKKVSQIIGYLREADMQNKGVGARDIDMADVLKELIFKILH